MYEVPHSITTEQAFFSGFHGVFLSHCLHCSSITVNTLRNSTQDRQHSVGGQTRSSSVLRTVGFYSYDRSSGEPAGMQSGTSLGGGRAAQADQGSAPHRRQLRTQGTAPAQRCSLGLQGLIHSQCSLQSPEWPLGQGLGAVTRKGRFKMN